MRPINANFADFMRINGITPPDYVGDFSKVTRFDVKTGRVNTAKSGWCCQFDDDSGGVFGDWATGYEDVWHSEKVASMSATDRKKYDQEIKKKRAIIEKENKKERLKVAEFLNDEYEKRIVCANNPLNKYLNQKILTEFHYRYKVDQNQDLIMPLRDLVTGLIYSIQTIYKDGQKRFATGGEVKYKGLIITGKDTTEVKTVNDLLAFDSVAICEGLATALTVREALNIPVIVAFSGGNLVNVAKTVRAYCQEIKIIVCADNDTSKETNAGLDYARKASSVSGGFMVLSSGINGTDFNDDYVNAGQLLEGGFDAQAGLLTVRESINQQFQSQYNKIIHDTTKQAPVKRFDYIEHATYQVMIVCENDFLVDIARAVLTRRNHIHREGIANLIIAKSQITETVIRIKKEDVSCPVFWVAFGESVDWIERALSCGMVVINGEDLEHQKRYGFKRVSGFVNDAIEKHIKSIMPTVTRFPTVSKKPIFREYIRGYFPANTVENIRILLEWEGIGVRYNIMTHDIEFSSENAIGKNYVMRKECFVTEVESCCNRYEIKVSRMGLYKTITNITVNDQYHPVKDWISGKEWDGQPRLNRFIGAINTKADKISESLKYMLITKWMLGAVYALFTDNPEALQGILVLQGRQGCGKTNLVRKLCPIDDSITIGATIETHSVDSIRNATGAWITELGEIDATFRKSDIAQLKQLVTQKKDKYRVPYGVDIETYTRRTAFIATVNEELYLVDETGNRRFWTIPVESINIDEIKDIDIQQVWAEVRVMLNGGEAYYLEGEEITELDDHNASFEPPNPYRDSLMTSFCWDQIYKRSNEMTVFDIAEFCGYQDPNRATSIAFGKLITNMGIESKRRVINGQKHTLYVMPDKRQDFYNR